MEDLEFVDNVYDPVWKSIPITQIEKDIIETDIFRRLKNIKQMSLASISFSGANHTRFEHSIGTMHVSYLIASRIEGLKENANLIFLKEHGLENGFNITLQFLRIAGLLHDLGHPPFSHAIEWVFERSPELYPGKKYSHDTYTQELIKRNKQMKQILNDKIISTNNISNFLANKLKNVPKPIVILYPLLNGDLDFDKIDYIIRDNYHCGFPVNVDIYSIMDSFKIRVQKQKEHDYISNIEIHFKPEKIHVVENLLLSRKQLIAIIQQEKNNRIANQMLMVGTKDYLNKKRRELEDKEYKELIRILHEEWTDYELVTNVTNEIKSGEANYLDRAIKGNLMQELTKIEMFDLEPMERLDFYMFSKFKERKIAIEQKLNIELKTNFLVDFIYIKPPPLTIRLTPDFEERVTSIEYSREPVAFPLHSKSNIINGILKDSFTNSFIAVYGNGEYNSLKIIEKLRFFLKLQNLDIRRKLIDKKQILEEDLVLIILSAIRELAKDKFKLSRLWITGVKRFQEFASKFIKTISFNCPEFDKLTLDNLSKFDILMTKLVTLGLVDQRNKHISIRTAKGEETIFRFLDRFDYCLNSGGTDFVDNLPTKLLKIRDELLQKMLDNYELYYEYLTRDFELRDVVRQKDMRPELEKKGLPIIDI